MRSILSRDAYGWVVVAREATLRLGKTLVGVAERDGLDSKRNDARNSPVDNTTDFAAAALVATGTTTLAFVVLPIARRSARVRRGHIGRCFGYSVVMLPLAVAVAARVLPMRETLVGYHGLELGLDVWTWVGLFAWYTLFWWASAGRYLHMARPLAVGASVAALGTTVAIVLLAVPSIILFTISP